MTQKKLWRCHENIEKNRRKKRRHTIKNIKEGSTVCEVCGCKVKKCNWLRHLGTKKHRDGVENRGGGGDIGGEGGGRREKLN